MRFRQYIANALQRATQLLDPARPRVMRNADGSHTITVGATALARISPGQIADARPEWRP